jgi:hypothetical protein
MNRRLRVAIHISTSTGDQRSSSTEASCNVIIACPRETPERRVETESTSLLNGHPNRARPSMRATAPGQWRLSDEGGLEIHRNPVHAPKTLTLVAAFGPSGHRPCRRSTKSSPRRKSDVPGDLLCALFGNVTESLHQFDLFRAIPCRNGFESVSLRFTKVRCTNPLLTLWKFGQDRYTFAPPSIVAAPSQFSGTHCLRDLYLADNRKDLVE